MSDLEYLTRVMAVLAKTECHDEVPYYRYEAGWRFVINCSDVFAWGGGDSRGRRSAVGAGIKYGTWNVMPTIPLACKRMPDERTQMLAGNRPSPQTRQR